MTDVSSIWPRDRTLSGAITPSQSGPVSNSNEGILHILQSSCIIGASLSDGLVSYTGHSLLWGRGLTSLQRCSQCILQPQLSGLIVGWIVQIHITLITVLDSWIDLNI